MTPRTVLLVGDGWQRGTLSATRSLGAAGHRVVLGSPRPGHAARSRFAHAWVATPPVGRGLARRVAEIAARHRVDVVFAGDDEHLLELSARRDELGGAVFPYAPHTSVLQALDKLTLYRAAAEVDLAVPVFSSEPPADTDPRDWVAKPQIYGEGADHAVYAADESLPDEMADQMVFQVTVEGRMAAVVTFCDDSGHLRYLGGQIAHRVYPEPHGVSVRADVVEVPPTAAAGVERLLGRLGWRGVAELQFMVSPGEEWQLIDFNGRFFGSLALTAAAGVDLPTAWVDLATGSRVSLPSRPQEQVSYQWLEGDLRRALSGSARTREVAGALRFAAGAAHSLWRMDDPGPAVFLGARLARSAGRRARGAVGAR